MNPYQQAWQAELQKNAGLNDVLVKQSSLVKEAVSYWKGYNALIDAYENALIKKWGPFGPTRFEAILEAAKYGRNSERIARQHRDLLAGLLNKHPNVHKLLGRNSYNREAAFESPWGLRREQGPNIFNDANLGVKEVLAERQARYWESLEDAFDRSSLNR